MAMLGGSLKDKIQKNAKSHHFNNVDLGFDPQMIQELLEIRLHLHVIILK